MSFSPLAINPPEVETAEEKPSEDGSDAEARCWTILKYLPFDTKSVCGSIPMSLTRLATRWEWKAQGAGFDMRADSTFGFARDNPRSTFISHFKPHLDRRCLSRSNERETTEEHGIENQHWPLTSTRTTTRAMPVIRMGGLSNSSANYPDE